MSGLPFPRRDALSSGRSAGSFPEQRLVIEPRERNEAKNHPLLDSDKDDSDEDDNGASKRVKAVLMRGMKMITLTLVIETSRLMSFLRSSMTKKKLRGQP